MPFAKPRSTTTVPCTNESILEAILALRSDVKCLTGLVEELLLDDTEPYSDEEADTEEDDDDMEEDDRETRFLARSTTKSAPRSQK